VSRGIELLLSFYQASMKQIETTFFKEGKTHVMNANKIDTKPNIKKAF